MHRAVQGCKGLPRQIQTGPSRPRKAQTGPGRPKQAQAGPGRPRQAQAGPGRRRQAQTGPGRPRKAQAGPRPRRHAARSPWIHRAKGADFRVILSSYASRGREGVDREARRVWAVELNLSLGVVRRGVGLKALAGSLAHTVRYQLRSLSLEFMV